MVKINWDTVGPLTEYMVIEGDRVPINAEGMAYLAAKIAAMEIDIQSLTEENRTLESMLRDESYPDPRSMEYDPYG